MPDAAPLLRDREGPWTVVGQRCAAAADVGSVDEERPRLLHDLLSGWSVPAEVIARVETLTEEITAQAMAEGHGVVSTSVSFVPRRLRVALVATPGQHGSPGRVGWLELSPTPAGDGTQPELVLTCGPSA